MFSNRNEPNKKTKKLIASLPTFKTFDTSASWDGLAENECPPEINYDLAPHLFVDDDGRLNVSSENGAAGILLDYYGEFRGEYPWVEPKLESWAEKHHGYWEWVNPGHIVFIEG